MRQNRQVSHTYSSLRPTTACTPTRQMSFQGLHGFCLIIDSGRLLRRAGKAGCWAADDE
jgi:hypothetical protein